MANSEIVPDRIRQEFLDKLRWNVFGPLSEILVKEGNTIVPFSESRGATESLANPPISKVSVHIDVCEQKHDLDEHEDEYRYQPPKPLVIEKKFGEPITLGDFVIQAHDYSMPTRRNS
ncbi:hypothetical protein EK21DRAFT_94234 [Setomelanomma holmii]|uniref:Uncharacterized protein n=1 Tax=Setomelanomma holmii TaxID=210430 RepID=A0A9P4H020_9PLEO|nr:hypothetical protein EK21DRAFT_94234 [Setomelanomma holmii]